MRKNARQQAQAWRMAQDLEHPTSARGARADSPSIASGWVAAFLGRTTPQAGAQFHSKFWPFHVRDARSISPSERRALPSEMCQIELVVQRLTPTLSNVPEVRPDSWSPLSSQAAPVALNVPDLRPTNSAVIATVPKPVAVPS